MVRVLKAIARGVGWVEAENPTFTSIVGDCARASVGYRYGSTQPTLPHLLPTSGLRSRRAPPLAVRFFGEVRSFIKAIGVERRKVV